MHKFQSFSTFQELLEACSNVTSPYWEVGWREFIKRYKSFIHSKVTQRCSSWNVPRIQRQISDFVNDIVDAVYATLYKNECQALRNFTDRNNERLFLSWLATICERTANRYIRGMIKECLLDEDYESQQLLLEEHEDLRERLVSLESNQLWDEQYEPTSSGFFEPSQSDEELWAKTIELARKAADVAELSSLDNIVAQLPEGMEGFLSQTAALRGMVNELCELQLRLDTITRPVLREPLTQILCRRIENFCHQIAGFHEPLASEFGNAATRWLKLAQKQLQHVQAVANNRPRHGRFWIRCFNRI